MIGNGYSLEDLPVSVKRDLIQYVTRPQNTNNHKCACCHEPIDNNPKPFRRNQNTQKDISRGDINYKEEYCTDHDSAKEVIKKRLLEIINKLADSDSELDEDQITIEATITFEVDPAFTQNKQITNTDNKSTSDKGDYDYYSTAIVDNKTNTTKTKTDEEPSNDTNKNTKKILKPTKTYINKNFEDQTVPKETDPKEEVRKQSLCGRLGCPERALHKCSR